MTSAKQQPFVARIAKQRGSAGADTTTARRNLYIDPQAMMWLKAGTASGSPSAASGRTAQNALFLSFIIDASSTIGDFSISIADARDEIEDSRLSSAGKRIAFRARAIIRQHAPQLIEELAETDDGGLIMEYTSRTTDREITLLLPSDGAFRYFVASGPGVRHAGIVLSDDALGEMARWTAASSPFPGAGLAIGRSAAPRGR